MTKRTVLFLDGVPLLLSSIRRDPRGNILSGHVVNGAWNLSLCAGEAFAKDGRCVVNRWNYTSYQEVSVPEEWRGDYNAIIGMAQGVLAAEGASDSGAAPSTEIHP